MYTGEPGCNINGNDVWLSVGAGVPVEVGVSVGLISAVPVASAMGVLVAAGSETVGVGRIIGRY